MAAAGLLTAFVVLLHVRHFARAGPLWRDEISSVAIATSPTVGDWYHNKVNDSAPMGWDAVVRAWAWAGPGRTDGGLRVLGLAVGVGVAAALWANARAFGVPTPVVSLTLLGLNGLAVCYGDSLRAYGPGMLAGLLCAGAVFRLSRARPGRPTWTAAAWAGLATLAATHANFFDAAWVLAACLGGAAVCGTHGRWRRAAGVLAIGAGCAATLPVYAGVVRARAGMGQFFVYPTTLPRVLAALWLAVGRTPLGTVPAAGPVWAGVVTAAVVVGCRGWSSRRADRSPSANADAVARRRDAAAFCGVMLVTGTTAYVGVLRGLNDSLAWVHYLVLFALAATSVDGLLAVAGRPSHRRLVAAGAAVVTVGWAGDAWRAAGVRLSNVDRVAARLAALAGPGDVVVVDPWWVGSAVARYYHGPAAVVTVPPVADLRFQRFDLVVPALTDPRAIDPVLARVAAATATGHHVWFVMHPAFTLAADPGVPLPEPRPTWNEVDYYALWTRRIALALQRDGVRRVRVVDVDGGDADVSPFEHLQLLEPTR